MNEIVRGDHSRGLHDIDVAEHETDGSAHWVVEEQAVADEEGQADFRQHPRDITVQEGAKGDQNLQNQSIDFLSK